MAGGVQEWVSDEYDPGYYERSEDWQDPENVAVCRCDFCPMAVRRGGDFASPTGDGALDLASTFFRPYGPARRGSYGGVRCVWDP